MNAIAYRTGFLGLCLLLSIGTNDLMAGWLGSADGRPRIFSRAWWQMRAQDPEGARQVEIAGKYWPPQPRPVGPPQLPVHQYYAAHYWPYPWVCEDRHYVRSLSQLQTNNGWVTMTTLYDYHFDPDTETLNKAGRLQLRWILENAPTSHRFCFVQATTNNERSQLRLASVQHESSTMVGADNMPPILLRLASPLSRPALEVDMIRRRELETMFKPRISDPIESGGASPELGNQ
jgi:hypothetical protein